MKSLATSLGSAYHAAHKNTTVTVDGGGSASGFTALADGTADLAQSSRSIAPEERAAVEAKRQTQVTETPVAFETVAIYVNPANPVQQLSLKQIAAIVGGTTKNWKDVGGPSAPIVLYGQKETNGFTSFLGAGQITPQPQSDFADAKGTIAAVAGDPNGFGYARFVPTTQAHIVWVQAANGGNAIAPSTKTVLDRSYPLSSRLYVYTVANAPEPVKQFVAWTKSAGAKKVLEDAGYVQAK